MNKYEIDPLIKEKAKKLDEFILTIINLPENMVLVILRL